MKTDWQVGEKVTIRTDLEKTPERDYFLPERYVTFIWESMLKFRGTVVTIGRNDEDCCLRILEDAGLHRWTWELFEESYEGEMCEY